MSSSDLALRQRFADHVKNVATQVTAGEIYFWEIQPMEVRFLCDFRFTLSRLLSVEHKVRHRGQIMCGTNVPSNTCQVTLFTMWRSEESPRVCYVILCFR